MVFSRGESGKALEHLLTVVLELSETDPAYIALEQNGINKVTKLITMERKEVKELTYEANGVDIPLKPAETIELIQAMDFFNSLEICNSIEEIKDATSDEFTFIVSLHGKTSIFFLS